MRHLPARALLGLLWLLHWLPLPLLAALGSALGRLLYTVARERRRIAARNVQLCLPELDAKQRRDLLRRHFRWLGRSAVERALLWYASPARLKRLIHVEGDVGLAERSEDSDPRDNTAGVPGAPTGTITVTAPVTSVATQILPSESTFSESKRL